MFPLCFSSYTVLFSFHLFLLAFRSQADSGEEITDSFLYPRFKLGAQSGLDGSSRAAGLLKIKRLAQTCSVEFFSSDLLVCLSYWLLVPGLAVLLINKSSNNGSM